MGMPPEVAERIGPYYVYVLVDPRDESIFYVGKGKGDRLRHHGYEALLKADPGPRSGKVARIREVRKAGYEPRIDVVRHHLEEREALLVEAALIDCVEPLTNKKPGHGAAEGRTPLDELVVQHGATEVDPGASPVLLVRLGDWKEEREKIETGVFRNGRGFRPDMTVSELVDSTRAWWKTVSPNGVKKRGVRHAVAVHNGVTRAVMEIGDWTLRGDRWAFGATLITDGPVHEEWVGRLGRRVSFRQGSRIPTVYWPLKP